MPKRGKRKVQRRETKQVKWLASAGILVCRFCRNGFHTQCVGACDCQH